MPDQPQLQTERLLLEPLVPEHAARTFDLWQDERLYEFIPIEPPTDVKSLEDRYRTLATRRSPDGAEEWLNWMARTKADGAYVGLVQATVRSDSSGYLAYFTFAPHWRFGFAFEACRAVVDFLTEARGVGEIVAEIDTRNAASIRLIEKLGFTRAAFTPNAATIRGTASDEYRYELRVTSSLPRPRTKQRV